MTKSSVTKKRKWSEKYTRFGFTVTKGSDGEEKLQYILCRVTQCYANKN